MRAAAFVLLLVTSVASAQSQLPPDWSPSSGWGTDFDRDAEAVRTAHEERSRAMHESFEVKKQQMDDEFDRTARWMFGGFAVVVVLLGIAAAVSAAQRRRQAQVVWTPPVESAPPVINTLPSGFDVCVLRIAVDGRASKFVQAELDAIVKAYDPATESGRARCLREVSIMLRRVRESWVYGGVDNEPMRPRADALAAYMRHVDDARTRVRKTQPPVAPRSAQPTSLILVSIIVATRGELMTMTDLATGEDLRRALEAVVHRPAADLIGCDVVWEPREPGSTLSSIDLESAYRASELHRLQGAVVGKTFCTYCGGPFPMELVTCPHCGAPAREQRSAS